MQVLTKKSLIFKILMVLHILKGIGYKNYTVVKPSCSLSIIIFEKIINYYFTGFFNQFLNLKLHKPINSAILIESQTDLTFMMPEKQI